MNENNQTSTEIIGRLAKRPYQSGDPLPAVGSLCLVSGANSDVESDQHRSYLWRKELRQQLESQAVPDGWCPICGGQNGEHKTGCQDGSEVL